MNEKYIAQNFYMNPSYKTNPIAYFDDTELKDEWQNEVYLYAKDIVEQNNYKNIVDFGCGSGYKLIKYFNEYNTIGIDLPPTVHVLRERYPAKVWQDTLDPIDCDVFIASDVIEHMENPDILLDFIKKCNPKEIILSTPARNLYIPIQENGPPQNINHIREWSVDEFRNYIESRFQIINHKITNEEQHTQMIHAKLNTTDKEIANLFWHGELTNLEKTCIQSFVKQGFQTKLWSYTGLQVDGVESCDARLILSEEHLTKYNQAHFAGVEDVEQKVYSCIATFSDVFRWNLLQKFGGWWFDTDCYCLKSADEFTKLKEGKQLIAGSQTYKCPSINCAVVYANDNILNKLNVELNKLCKERNYTFPKWGEVGPLLLSNIIQKYDLYNEVFSCESFYSIEYINSNYFVDPSLKNQAKSFIVDSYITHIWHSQLKLNGIDRNNPPEGSLLKEFYDGTYTNLSEKNTIISEYNKSLERYVAISKIYKKILKRYADIEGLGGYVKSELSYENIEKEMLNTEEYKKLGVFQGSNLTKPINPLVSVIVTCYNLEKYLATALDSLLNQTYKNIEIIVISDASPGDTDSVIQPYLKYDNVVYIKNKVNKGLATSRNIAIQQSTGEFICALDADDYFDTKTISLMVSEIENEYSLVRVKTVFTDENRKEIEKVNYTNLNWSPHSMYMDNIVNVCTMFSRKLFDNVGGYDESFYGLEDWDLYLRLSMQDTHLKTVDEWLFFYMVRPNSMLRTIDFNKWYYRIKNKYKELQTEREAKIIELYETILNRLPEKNGLSHYYYSNMNIEQIRDILLNSEEYTKINKKD